MSLTIEERRNYELMEMLENERIDVAFSRLPPDDQGPLVLSVLLEEPMVVALPSDHALARRNRNVAIPLKALANETFIAPASQLGWGSRAAALKAFRAAGFTPRTGQEVPRTITALNFVAAGLGITFAPASLQRLRVHGVAYRRLEGALGFTAPLNLLSRRGDPSAVVRHFSSLVKNAAKNFAGD